MQESNLPPNFESKIDAINHLVTGYKKPKTIDDFEKYLNDFNYWFTQFDIDINRWEDDGGYIL